MDDSLRLEQLFTLLTANAEPKINLESLVQVREVMSKNSSMAVEFLPRLVELLHGKKNAYVRKALLELLDKSCSIYPEGILQCYEHIDALVQDPVPALVKEAILFFTNTYRQALKRLCVQNDSWGQPEEELWKQVQSGKTAVLIHIDHVNEGVRSNVLKFMESLILAFTKSPRRQPDEQEGPFSISDIPRDHPKLSTVALLHEADAILQQIIDGMGKYSAVNLSIAVTILEKLARSRTQFIERVIPVLMKLQTAAMPDINESQKKRVQHVLKTSMATLFNFRPALQWRDAIAETMGWKKAKPTREDQGEAGAAATTNTAPTATSLAPPSDSAPRKYPKLSFQADLNDTAFSQLLERLGALPPPLVYDLVVKSMQNLEVELPNKDHSPHFLQFLGHFNVKPPRLDDRSKQPALPKTAANVPEIPIPVLAPNQARNLAKSAFQRILDASTESAVSSAGPAASAIRFGVIAKLATLSYTRPFLVDQEGVLSEAESTSQALISHIVADFPKRYELAMTYLYSLLARPSKLRGVKRGREGEEVEPELDVLPTENDQIMLYNNTVQALLTALDGVLDFDKKELIACHRKLFLDLPLWTPAAMTALKEFCLSDAVVSMEHGLEILNELSLHRVSSREATLHALLEYCWHPRSQLRQQAINIVANRLFRRDFLQPPIQAYAIGLLDKILDENTLDHIPPLPVPALPPELEKSSSQAPGKDKVSTPIPGSASPPPTSIESTKEESISAASPNHALELESIAPAASADLDESEGEGQEAEQIQREIQEKLAKAEEEKKKRVREDKEKERQATRRKLMLQEYNLKLRLSKERDQLRTEEVNRYMALFLALCPHKHSLVVDLLHTYAKGSHFLQTCIHKQAGDLIKSIGAGSKELLNIIKNCPVGSEMFVLQKLHILTSVSSAPPSPDLVRVVKDLYMRKQDARFLIPILPGLSKDQTKALLPKIVNLPSKHVKAAIHRLLHARPTPLAPAELLVALHLLDTNPSGKKGDQLIVPIQKVIEATRFCFKEPKIFKQQVLAVVLQQLVDHTPIPCLFMRTLIQTLVVCPKLKDFAMGTLSRLVGKRVWDDPVLWEGFVKCCNMTVPHSLPVLLQLPPIHLSNMLKQAPELKKPLRAYAEQQKGVRRSLLDELGIKETPKSSKQLKPPSSP